MNILILADEVAFTGVGNYIRFLATKFVSQGDCVVIATAKDDLHIDGVETILLKNININPFNMFSNLRKLRTIIKKHSIDIVHVNHRMSAFVMKMYNSFFLHIPVVWTSHLSEFPMNFVKKIMGYYGDKSIAISTESKRFMLDVLGISDEKIELVYNGVDERELLSLNASEKIALKTKWGVPFDKIVMAVHGRIAYSKGVDFLVDTLEKLDSDRLNKIVIVCSGQFENNAYYDQLINYIKSKNLQDKFIFTGWCKTRDILGIADIMLQPSRIEGFPLADAEAFLMGVPVIRTMEGGYLDMKNICIGVPFGDVDILLNHIIDFIDNPKVYSDMASYAQKEAFEKFTSDVMSKQTYGVYLSLVNNRK